MTGHRGARYFAHTLAALVFMSLGATTVLFGQDVEAYFWPVVVETKPADEIYRDEDKVCFTLHLAKALWGVQPRYEYYAEVHYSGRLPVAVYPSDRHHGKYGQDIVTHAPGDKWDRVFCFQTPATIAYNQSIRISGHAEHERHRGWRSASYLAPFKVCGLIEDDPPPEVPRRADPYCDRQRESFAKAAAPKPP